jgi:hypothetical protein
MTPDWPPAASDAAPAGVVTLTGMVAVPGVAATLPEVAATPSRPAPTRPATGTSAPQAARLAARLADRVAAQSRCSLWFLVAGVM